MQKSLLYFLLFSITTLNQCIEDRSLDLGPWKWQKSGIYKLPNSHSTLSLPDQCIVLIGKEANACNISWGGESNSAIEAIVYHPESGGIVSFEYDDTGYVSLENWYWKDKDSEAIEAIMKQSVVDEKWLCQPTVDYQKNIIYSAFEIRDKNGFIAALSSAWHFGRKGIEIIEVIAPKDTYVPIGQESLVEIMAKAHTFDSGFEYKDFKAGDEKFSCDSCKKIENLWFLIKKVMPYLFIIGIGFLISKYKAVFRE